MPFQPEIRPLKFDKFNLMPYADWEREEWNNRITRCDRIDLNYCQKVALTDPFDRVQFKPNFTGSNLLPTEPAFTGTSGTYLADHVNATGIGTASEVNYLVYNATTGQSAQVVSIVSADSVELSADIFPTPGHTVQVYDYFAAPSGVFSVDDGLICKSSYAGLATLTPDVPLTMDTWYYVRLEVRNYVSGELTVQLGTNEVGMVDTNGYHEFYGQMNGSNISLQSSAAQDFVGCLVIASFELYEVNTDDLTVVWSPDLSTIIAAGPPSPVPAALNAGVFMDSPDPSTTWGDILGECRCFYLSVFSDPCYTKNLIQGDLKTEDCWELGSNISLASDSIVFDNTAQGEKARYTCEMLCPIECGQEYTLYLTVEDYLAGAVEIRFANGIYLIDSAGDFQFTRTPSGLCTGLDIFEITAVGDPSTDLSIKNIMIRKSPVFADATLVSEQMCACDAGDCEVLVEYRHPENVYGFAYEGEGLETYRNRLRFCGELTKRRLASNDYQAFKSSKGFYSTVYSDVDQTRTLESEWMPPYMAENLTVAMQHGDVLIDGKTYVLREWAQVSEQENTELVQVVLVVVEKDQSETYTYNA